MNNQEITFTVYYTVNSRDFGWPRSNTFQKLEDAKEFASSYKNFEIHKESVDKEGILRDRRIAQKGKSVWILPFLWPKGLSKSLVF